MFFVSVSGVSLCFRHVFVLFVSVSGRRAANILNIYDGSTFMRCVWLFEQSIIKVVVVCRAQQKHRDAGMIYYFKKFDNGKLVEWFKKFFHGQ